MAGGWLPVSKHDKQGVGGTLFSNVVQPNINLLLGCLYPRLWRQAISPCVLRSLATHFGSLTRRLYPCALMMLFQNLGLLRYKMPCCTKENKQQYTHTHNFCKPNPVRIEALLTIHPTVHQSNSASWFPRQIEEGIWSQGICTWLDLRSKA